MVSQYAFDHDPYLFIISLLNLLIQYIVEGRFNPLINVCNYASINLISIYQYIIGCECGGLHSIPMKSISDPNMNIYIYIYIYILFFL